MVEMRVPQRISKGDADMLNAVLRTLQSVERPQCRPRPPSPPSRSATWRVRPSANSHYDLRPPAAYGPSAKPVVKRASGMRVFEPGEVVGHLQERGFTDFHQRLSGVVRFVGARLSAG
jgi:hypothetical protein